MSDVRPPVDILARLDQAQAELTSVAVLSGAYYRALLRGGCDEILARDLTRDWHFRTILNGTPEETE